MCNNTRFFISTTSISIAILKFSKKFLVKSMFRSMLHRSISVSSYTRVFQRSVARKDPINLRIKTTLVLCNNRTEGTKMIAGRYQ